MDSCPYYYEQVRVEGGKQTIPCCRHKHSPVPCRKASLLTEYPHLLGCEGRIGKCQIPSHEQFDIA